MTSRIIKNKRIWLLNRIDRLKDIYPELYKIYGPYRITGKVKGKKSKNHGRAMVMLYFDSKRLTTVQFSRIKMELKLKRKLDINETVDHKDQDIKNDRYENLHVISKSDHSKIDVVRLKLVDGICEWCGIKFKLSYRQMVPNKTLKSGPFCSPQCRGSYGAHVQNGGSIIPRKTIKREYITNKQLL